MRVCSMTGFGQAVLERDGLRVKVEIRSVNHRFAEFSLRLPRDLLALEDDVRLYLSSRIARGRADVFITLEEEKSAPKSVQVNWELLDALVRVEREARVRYAEAVPDSLTGNWLAYPDVLQLEGTHYDSDTVKGHVLDAVNEACDTLLSMRGREGERLVHDMLGKLDELYAVVQRIRGVAVTASEGYREKLQKRMQELALQVDEQRLLTEVMLFAERTVIDEELVRLESHIDEFRSSVHAGSPVGRRLDFVVQEMHREVNTIGSKSVDTAISKAVVDAKTLVEQLREQAQNIE